MNEKLRLQIDLSPKQVEELERLMTICNLSTKRELFNSSLSLLKWAVQEIQNGRIIASVDTRNEKYREITMPAFSNVSEENESRDAIPS